MNKTKQKLIRRLELRVIAAARNSAKCIWNQIGFTNALKDERQLISAVEALDDEVERIESTLSKTTKTG